MEHLTKALTNRRKLLVTGAAAGLLTSCGTLPPRIGREDRRPLEAIASPSKPKPAKAA